MPGKATGIKTAPPGHHVSPEDRRAIAMVLKGPRHRDVVRAVEADERAFEIAEERAALQGVRR